MKSARLKSTHTSTHRHLINTFVILLLLCALSLLVAIVAPVRQSAPPDAAAGMNSSTRLPTSTTTPATEPVAERAREAYGRMELSFEANRGQTAAPVNFLARGAGYTLFLKPAEAVFVMTPQGGRRKAHHDVSRERTQAIEDVNINTTARSNNTAKRARQHIEPEPQTTFSMKLLGARADAPVESADELAGKVNYFYGNDPAKWRTDIPTFGRVRYKEVYPGIDVVYYGNQRQLEYDFVVAPGSDARAVSLEFAGADKLEVDEGGDLLLTVGKEVVRQLKPVIYQETAGGARRAVEGGYVLQAGGRVGFRVGEYDASRPLVVDPVLVYSTYLGGNSTDAAGTIAVDSSGNAYVAGTTGSTNFPTANPLQPALSDVANVFVTKINAAGTALVYSTYLGGNSSEQATGIALDSSGNVYITGFTGSTTFPTVNPIKGARGCCHEDAFVAKLNASGSALVYSTYLGGNASADFAEDIALDSSGNVYVTGRTHANDFPLVNPIQGTLRGFSDVFVTKINAAGSAFVYSTYLGGSLGDGGAGIVVDASDNAYVTGTAESPNFPLANPLQRTYNGGSSDAFVAKLNAAGSALIYSTYLGGGDDERSFDIAIDSSGNAYAAGDTLSTDFPVANAIQSTKGGKVGTYDAFVTKINASGSALVYSTYLGGLGNEFAFSIAVDAAGSAHVTGRIDSFNSFPLLNAIQCTRKGFEDMFITKFNAAGSALVYSTYLGGTEVEAGRDIALDSSGNVYLVGGTTSVDFPTVNPIQSTFGSHNQFAPDAFITKLNNEPTPNPCTPAPPPPTPTPPPPPTPTPSPTPCPVVIIYTVSNAVLGFGADTIKLSGGSRIMQLTSGTTHSDLFYG
ncbi:MAG TPA: SBBP repeat-containing protein, partial [Pyrinomonadaceae bacterium]